MKTLVLSLALAFVTCTAFALTTDLHLAKTESQSDSIRLKIDSNRVFYQRTIKVDSNITVNLIYLRALQFMAAKNIQQNYGYEQEGKLIFTTVQDLNITPIYVGDENDAVNPYTVQFAITLDLKRGRYRYTISNVVFFLPTETGNKRETLYDVYLKATNKDSKRIARNADNMIKSFEIYLNTLTNELYDGIEQKAMIYNSKF